MDFWAVSDLHKVTSDVLGVITNAVTAAAVQGFSITPSDSMPDSVRQEGDCQLTLSLLHVSQDKFQWNNTVRGPTPEQNQRQPLSLDLYYLLSAYAGTHADQEQLAMSIAMRALHANPILHPTHSPAPPATEHYTVTMEVETADEMARLWQALSTAMRLSVVYKVSVVFLEPADTSLPKLAAPPQKLGLAVAPSALPVTVPTQLFGATTSVQFVVPQGASPSEVTEIVAPSVVRAGDTMLLTGVGLQGSPYDRIYLTAIGGGEVDITSSWNPVASNSKIELTVPKTAADAPAPGFYLLELGSNGPPAVRSNAIPVAVAARIDNVSNPLQPSNGLYTFSGVGFSAGKLELQFGSISLRPTLSLAPGPGEFLVDSKETSVQFMPPAGLAKGRYYLGIRVNQVDSPPSWYVDL